MLRAGKVSPLVKSPLIKAPQNLHFTDIIVISLYDLLASNLAFSRQRLQVREEGDSKTDGSTPQTDNPHVQKDC